MAIADFSTGIRATLRQRMLDDMAQQKLAHDQWAQEQQLAQGDRRIDQDATQFDARLGLDSDALGFRKQVHTDEAPERDARTGYLRTQSKHLEGADARTAAERAFETGRDAQQHRYRLGEIGAQGAIRAPRDKKWVIRNGQPMPVTEGEYQPGDVPYDKALAPQDTAAARESTQTALSLVDRLLGVDGDPKQPPHEGMGAATGAYELRGFTQPAQDFNGIRDQLVATLTLPNLGALKGPMSDKDVVFVKQLATRLGNKRLSDAETRRALAEARVFLKGKLASGGTTALGAGQPSGGGGRTYYDADGNPVQR